MQLGNFKIDNPLALGPMAGVTDWAFRTICAELGANITVTEMVSSRALLYRAAFVVRRFLEMILRSWLKVQGSPLRFPDVIFWTSIWVALCLKLPIVATAQV